MVLGIFSFSLCFGLVMQILNKRIHVVSVCDYWKLKRKIFRFQVSFFRSFRFSFKVSVFVNLDIFSFVWL